MSRRSLTLLAYSMLLAACGGTQPNATALPTVVASAATPTPIPTEDVMSEPSLDGSFPVGEADRSLAITCWGEGSPTIILEAGHPSSGLEQFGQLGRSLVTELATETHTCAYDRAGYGRSDPAPEEPRDLDDVTDDLHALLEAAAIDGPYILVGSSFGGFIVTYYAHRFPKDIDGVVLLDVPAPSAELTLQEAPELAWDDPSNPEHVDVVPEFENRLATERFPFDAPLVVITATAGQSDMANQGFWLEWSADSRQVEIEGGHTVYEDSPEAVAQEILTLAN